MAGKFETGPQLRSVSVRKWTDSLDQQYPFNLPVIQSLETIQFSSPVTILVGENGCGKSTLLEALAVTAGSVVVGSESLKTDASLAEIRTFAKYIKLVWNKRTHRGFFLRAEDFFGFARHMTKLTSDLQHDLDAVDDEYKERSPMAKDLARMPYTRELHGIQQRYGQGLERVSHGESFLKLFQARFVPGGLYLLDEPEAPLSPVRQLAFIAMVKEMVAQDAQFVIATHSPILMAFPGATILNFDSGKLQDAEYEDLEHVTLMRAFLNDPQAFLRRL